jgi:O-antigen ligase/polysaccharide polymerase Wzy-like membrane protein
VDRLTKIVVLVWTSAALALEIWLLTSGWSNLPLLMIGVGALMLVLGLFQKKIIALVLVAAYAFPALVGIWHGGAHYTPHEALWMVALVAAIFPDAVRSGWHIPSPWRAVLITAALVIVVTSPIVILREIDWNPGLLTDMHGWNWGGATWPSIGVTWSLYVALTLVVGLLWFDWLFATDIDLHAFVLTPLVIGGFVMAAVSIYQLLVDVRFLNETVYGAIGRASGTMYDSNVSGTISALLIGASFLWARRMWPRTVAPAVIAVIANWLAVWATGSRTAFLAAAVVTVFIGISLVREHALSRARVVWAGALFVTAVMIVVALAGMMNPATVGPLGRVRATLPSLSASSMKAFAAEMWNRNQYGIAATSMFRQNPLFGIGVGAFHTLASDYIDGGLPPDNAQNWLRHQVVEFGLLGSLVWIIWFVAFGLFVVRTRLGEGPSLWVTRGILLGFALISMLGMPGQDVMVVITFWTIAFWHVSLAGRPAAAALSRWTWTAVMVAVVVVAAGTTEVALTRLRVPVRALAEKWPYAYGFSSPESGDDKAGYRRTRSHAVAVLEAPYQWMAVSVRLDHKGDEPVDVRVWTNGAALLKGRLDGTVPLTAFVQLPNAPARVLLEAASRKAGSRRPFAVRGSESLILVKWEFLERAPAPFNGYPRPISS